jgi:hypothetical protein
MAAIVPKPPTGEIGSSREPGSSHLPGTPGWAVFMQQGEHVPELTWPASNSIFEKMLTNPQVWALFMGFVLPLTEYDYGIEPGDADPAMTAKFAADVGLPVGLPDPGETAPVVQPGLYRFDFLEHLWEALFALVYGHYYFEQVGVIGDDGLWHLRKLAARSPHLIRLINTDDDGGLAGIHYPGMVKQSGSAVTFLQDVPIPVDRLVAYVWLPDARRRWIGRSMLRACYEPWLLRDHAVRIDIVNHMKAGGVPNVETDETWQGGDLRELQEMASSFNVGQESGFALPPGAHFKLARMGGTDVIASARYHDETMARAWGMMVRQLGTSATGSRALGGTFQELEAVVRRSVMRWFAGKFREHVIEDWWEYNVPLVNGVLPPIPSLAWRPRDDVLAAIAPVEAVPAAVPPGGAPANPPVAPLPVAAGHSGDAARRADRYAPAILSGGHGDALARVRGGDCSLAAASRLPARELRRQPYAHEIAAAVDFAAMDLAYETGFDRVEHLLETDWLPSLVASAHDAVAFTKKGADRKRLTRADAARMRLPAPDTLPLRDILLDMARAGAAAAITELAEQGHDVLPLSDVELEGLVTDHAAAVAQQTADGVTMAASRRAVQLTGSRSPVEVADEVRSYVGGLKHQWERDQLGGAIHMATNTARFAVFGRIPAEAPEAFYASELLDTSTCPACAGVDGREYASLEQATRDYPSGGYLDCRGGPRCRGTVIAVMHEAGIAPGTAPNLGPG